MRDTRCWPPSFTAGDGRVPFKSRQFDGQILMVTVREVGGSQGGVAPIYILLSMPLF